MGETFGGGALDLREAHFLRVRAELIPATSYT